MTHVLRVVDKIDASRTTLLDLKTNGRSVDNWDAPPPELRRSVAGSSLGDGDLLMAASYGDRKIEFDLNMLAGSSDASALEIQRLSHYLGNGDAWLEFQKNGATNPVFFRTKRADINNVREFWIGPAGDRVAHLSIPCAPFAKGLPESFGPITIANDPTTGTNKMKYAFGAIKGDVSSELYLTIAIGNGARRVFVASEARFDGSVLAAPYQKGLSTFPKDTTPPAGWTITDTVDTAMVGGTRRAIAGSGVVTLIPTAATVLTWDNLPPGDYRVFIRIKQAGAPTSPLLFFNRPPRDGVAYTREEAVSERTYQYEFFVTASGPEWIDMGVAALPGDAPLSDLAYELPGAGGTVTWNAGLYAGGGLTFDTILLVPAGRPGTVVRHSYVSLGEKDTARTITLDGVNKRRFAKGQSLALAGTDTPVPLTAMGGVLPIVVPNAANDLYLMNNVTGPDPDRVMDDKTTTTVISGKYYPNYLLDRPSTT